MVGHAYIAIDGEEYPIGNLEEVGSLLLDLKAGMQLSIRWLGKLEVTAVCDNTYYRTKDGVQRKMIAVYCKKVIA